MQMGDGDNQNGDDDEPCMIHYDDENVENMLIMTI